LFNLHAGFIGNSRAKLQHCFPIPTQPHDLDRDKVNVNGGAMALGHPIAAGGMAPGTHLTVLTS
jgi:hypothetical protein